MYFCACRRGRDIMNQTKKLSAVVAVCLGVGLLLPGCQTTRPDEKETGTLVYEETLSPNEAYVTAQEDVVDYHISVYQKTDWTVVVQATSNTPLFDDQEYTVACDGAITEQDVTVTWTTLMGSDQASEEDQLSVATVTISQDGQELSQRKINFASGAIEIIVDAVEQNH